MNARFFKSVLNFIKMYLIRDAFCRGIVYFFSEFKLVPIKIASKPLNEFPMFLKK